MTEQEAKEIFEELKANGDTEEDIASKLYLMFTENELTVDQLGALLDILGYSLTEDFLKLSPEEQKKVGLPDEVEKPSIDRYIEKFGVMPPMLYGLNLDDERYVNLLEGAIKSGNELTFEQVEETFKNTPLDYVD